MQFPKPGLKGLEQIINHCRVSERIRQRWCYTTCSMNRWPTQWSAINQWCCPNSLQNQGTEGSTTSPLRKSWCNCNVAMVVHSQCGHEPSANECSACWMSRHGRRRSWLLSEDRKLPQPRRHGRSGIFKYIRAICFCSFRGNLLF